MHHRSWLAVMPEFFKRPMLLFDWHKFEKDRKKRNSDASFVPGNSDNKNCCIICRFLHHVKGGNSGIFFGRSRARICGNRFALCLALIAGNVGGGGGRTISNQALPTPNFEFIFARAFCLGWRGERRTKKLVVSCSSSPLLFYFFARFSCHFRIFDTLPLFASSQTKAAAGSMCSSGSFVNVPPRRFDKLPPAISQKTFATSLSGCSTKKEGGGGRVGGHAAGCFTVVLVSYMCCKREKRGGISSHAMSAAAAALWDSFSRIVSHLFISRTSTKRRDENAGFGLFPSSTNLSGAPIGASSSILGVRLPDPLPTSTWRPPAPQTKYLP